MDPLSIAASIIALCQAVNATSKGLQRILALKGAPKRLLSFHYEIEEISILLHWARDLAAGSTPEDKNTLIRFHQLAARTTELIEDAGKLVRLKLVKNLESLEDDTIEIKIRRVLLLWEEKNLKDIQVRLFETRQSLNSILMVESAVYARVTLRSVQLLNSAQGGPAQPIDDGSHGRIEEVQSSNETSRSSLDSEHEPIPVRALQVTSSKIPISQLAAPSYRPVSLQDPDYVSVEVSVERDTPHLDVCGCSCHYPIVVKTPNWLGNSVGTLLLRWYRNPQTCTRCSGKPCKLVKRNALSTQYYFPWWVWQRMVEFERGSRSTQRLTISLRTSAIIPEDSPVFLFAQHNNIKGIKRLFELNLASPFDVSYSGRTPLHFAATAVKAEMIEFLVKQEADPEMEDHNNLTPRDIVWELYLRNPKKRKNLLTAAGLGPEDTESLDKQNFTAIHHIVLGLGGTVDLDDYLKLSSSELDKRDWSGKTALSWAASRKDPSMVRTLLKHKASVHIPDSRGKTPLHYCAGSGLPESLGIILTAIQDLEKTSASGAKSIIEAQDEKGRTPLNFATRMDIASHVKLMIDHGANLEAADSKQKRTILLNALYWNSHNVITILLAHGAKTDVTDAQGATLLHYIARFSDLESLQILTDSELAYIDVNIVDITGRTAINIFNSEDTRYRPEEGIERERAVELFTIILGKASRGKENRTSIIEVADE